MNGARGVDRLMRAARALSAVLGILGLTGLVQADPGVLRLTCFPGISVADGRSSVTVSAELRDRSGRLAPDGTPVVFSSTLGLFREPLVQTRNGVARAILVAGTIPGVAKVSGSALSFSATSSTELEFVSDRSMLSSAKEYIEVVAPRYLLYAMDLRILGADGPGKGVNLRYREVEIDADDLQLNVPLYEVRARKARLRMGSVEQEFDELYLRLNERRGFGTAAIKGPSVELFGVGRYTSARVVEKIRYGIFEVRSNGLRAPKDAVPLSVFEFADLSESASAINAKKAVAFPRKEVHFHNAEIYVGGAKVVKLPLFQASLYGATPVLTEQILNVYDNQVSINYPHYLSLKPGQTSLLRFRTGDRYGRGYATSSGAFLDYELNWNQGDDMDGGLTLSGMGRTDWGIGMRQYWRFDEDTMLNAQVEFPAHRSVFGSGSISRSFPGYYATLTASSSRALRGSPYTSQAYGLVLERDPAKVGRLPLRFTFGATASYAKTVSSNFESHQSAVGIQARMQLLPQALSQSTTVNGSFSVAKLTGENTLKGLTYYADLSLSQRLGRDTSLLLTYAFAEDGYSSSFAGKHSLSAQAYYSAGRSSFSALMSRSLDIDRYSVFVDASYRVAGPWRLSYNHTYSKYIGESYLDAYGMISYQIGSRELGLLYSSRTKRFGIQVLGAPIH